jgi:hypothetical protein
MNILKHILVVVALLVTTLPCSHAVMHHEHEHGSAMDLCEVSAIPCQCHSCDHEPCSVQTEIQLKPAPDTQTTEQPWNPTVLFIVPEPRLAKSKNSPPVAGVLASILTIQLLI